MEDDEEDKEEGGGVKEPPLTEGQTDIIHWNLQTGDTLRANDLVEKLSLSRRIIR